MCISKCACVLVRVNFYDMDVRVYALIIMKRSLFEKKERKKSNLRVQ